MPPEKGAIATQPGQASRVGCNWERCSEEVSGGAGPRNWQKRRAVHGSTSSPRTAATMASPRTVRPAIPFTLTLSKGGSSRQGWRGRSWFDKLTTNGRKHGLAANGRGAHHQRNAGRACHGRAEEWACHERPGKPIPFILGSLLSSSSPADPRRLPGPARGPARLST